MLWKNASPAIPDTGIVPALVGAAQERQTAARQAIVLSPTTSAVPRAPAIPAKAVAAQATAIHSAASVAPMKVSARRGTSAIFILHKGEYAALMKSAQLTSMTMEAHVMPPRPQPRSPSPRP